jgi:predicted nucleic acid-binding protein
VGWVDTLRGQVVGLDTAPLIYFVEAHPTYVSIVRPFFQAMDRGEFVVITSIITLVEVLVHPLTRGDATLAQRYRDILLNSRGLTSIPVSENIAEYAARLRAAHNLRTPDSIQTATALLAGAGYFLTNDAKLAAVPGMQVLTLDALRSTP